MTDDFVNHPLRKLTNRENIFSRVDRLEGRTGARPSARLVRLSEASQSTGNLEVTGYVRVVDAATGEVIVQLDADGVKLQNSADGWFNFEAADGTYGQVNIANDPNNDFEFVNITTDGTISFFLKNDAGTTVRPIHIRQHPAVTDGIEVDFKGIASGATGRVGFGSDHFIDYLPTDGVGSATVYFNERNKNIDLNIQGQTDDNLLFADASLDGIGMGGAAVSGYKAFVTGNFGATQAAIGEKERSINDDAVYSFTPPHRGGFLFVAVFTAAGNTSWGIYSYRTVATAHMIAMAAGSNINATTGALTGTTGTDGNLTVSAHSDGKIYVENRLGAVKSVNISVI